MARSTGICTRKAAGGNTTGASGTRNSEIEVLGRLAHDPSVSTPRLVTVALTIVARYGVVAGVVGFATERLTG